MEDLLQGKYRILHEIGQGGMAVVYKGLDTVLEREVAVKVLHPHLAGRADSRIRLQREAKAVAKLHHPNILEIYDYSGAECEQSYIVTEYIRGETLKDFTDRHTPSLPEVGAMIVHEIAGAVAHAHEAGIIHRDIKPENMMIRDDGALKLMDFGIAQIVDMQQMTVTGALVGSPAHMSPEHVEGRPLDYRSDVFSLGTLLYFLCTGRLPFDSPSPHALLRQILEARYDDPRMHNPAVGRRLHQIIQRCLEREPDDRYESVDAFREDLGGYLSDLGLEDPASELVPYFDDPHTAEAELTQRVVDRLMALAERRSADGKVAAALEYYNQVLALQGDRADALARVQRLTSSRSRTLRMRQVALVAAGAALVAGVGWWALSGTEPEAPLAPLDRHAAYVPAAAMAAPAPRVEVKPAPAETPVVRVEAPAPKPAAVVVPEPPFVREVRPRDLADALQARRELVVEAKAPPMSLAERRRAAQNRAERPKPVRPAGAKPQPVAGGVRVQFRAPVQAMEIVFQGKVYKNGRTEVLSLTPGKYRATVRHPGCGGCQDRTYSWNIGPGFPSVMPVNVGFKPATLVVTGPPGSTVRVAGQPPGTTHNIRMTKYRDRRTVTVSKPGFKSVTRAASLEAGKTTRLSIPLEAAP